MKKITLLVLLCVLTFAFGSLFSPQAAFACDTLEKVTVDGITYNRVHSTTEPCPPANTAPSPLPGLVLPAETGPVSGGTNAIGGTGPVDLTTPTNDSSGKPKTTLGVAKEFDCGDPSLSGELSQAFSGFLNDIASRVGSEGLNSVLSGLGNSGTAGRIISDVFRGNSGNIGSSVGQAAGGYVSNALQGVFGNSQLGNAASRIVGNAAGQYVRNGVSSAVSNVAGQFGIGQGGLGGGALGSIGSAVGLGGGGGKVPTSNDTLEKTAEDTKRIVDDTKTLTTQLNDKSAIILRRECVTKQAAGSLVSAQIAKNSEKTIQNTSKLIIGSRTDFKEQVAHNAAKNFIENSDPSVQAFLNAVETGQEDPSSVTSNCGQGGDIFSKIVKQATDPSCTDSGKKIQAYSDLQSAKAAAVTQAEQLVTEGGGLKPDGTCQGHSDLTFEECQKPYVWVTNVPGSIAKDQLTKALSAPQDRLINTHDTGEIISDAFNSLLDEVFATVGNEIQGGIQGLGSRLGRGGSSGGGYSGSGSGFSGGTTHNGSYFDQLNGSTLTQSDVSSLVSQNIANAASVEATYRDTLQTMISNLQAVSDIFGNIRSCYQTLANGSPISITKEEAQTRANTASTTVSNVFAPQISTKRSELSVSLSTLARLHGYATQAAGETNNQNLNAISSAYQEMVDAHLTHTTADLQTLVNDMTLDAQALQVLGEDATAQLTSCQGLH